MDRRELLKMIAVATGGAVIGGELFLTGCTAGKEGTFTEFTEADIAYLDEIAETILPRTKTPGAKDAKVGQFITVMVKDCYTPTDQEVFREGMDQLNKTSKDKYGAEFRTITPEQRKELLIAIDAEAKEYQKKKSDFDKGQNEKQQEELQRGNQAYVKEEMSGHYFTMMKQITMLGFFTSKIGSTEALRFVAVPGRYDACIPYQKGDRAWAT